MDPRSRLIYIPVGRDEIQGDLHIPERAKGIVVFAHGSGSSRHSPRNKYVSDLLAESRIATLLIDLLTPDEELIDFQTAHLRFDIHMLADRLSVVTQWLRGQSATRALHFGYFGASTGAAAALVAGGPGRRVAGRIATGDGRHAGSTVRNRNTRDESWRAGFEHLRGTGSRDGVGAAGSRVRAMAPFASRSLPCDRSRRAVRADLQRCVAMLT